MKLPYFIETTTEGEDKGEIRILGKRFSCQDYAIFKMSQIRDQALLDLYKIMDVSLNNAHNDKRNIWLIFMLQEDETVDFALVHSHLEDANTWNLSAMVRILLELEYIMNKSSTVELWDNYWEKLLIHVHNVPYEFTKKAKKLKNLWLNYKHEDQTEEELDAIIAKYGGRY